MSAPMTDKLSKELQRAKLAKDIQRAQKAEQIMADPLMIEAKEHIEAELWRLFKSTVPTDFETLSQIKSMQYMQGKYEAFFKACVNDGKIAAAHQAGTK